MTPCTQSKEFDEKWEITKYDQIRQIDLNLCLDHKNLKPQDHIYVKECNEYSDTQKWTFD